MTKPQGPSRENHYVPEWYQKGFSPAGVFNFFLDLEPRYRPDGSPIPFVPRRKSSKGCFWEIDLYTTRFGEYVNDQIETVLFKGIDDIGAKAIRAFADADPVQMHRNYQALFAYLGAQKIRTPKGLSWIQSRYPALSQVELMTELQYLLHLYGTIWAEAVREIVSAEDSDVKFLVSDHPVTTFNAAWPLNLDSRINPNDAPVALNGTQTIFALDANHCLILTHLPYAKAPNEVPLTTKRENARNFASTLIRTDALVRSRRLSTDEVIAINHVLKSRARRYIAASESEWLYPEKLAPADLNRISNVLLPPQDELWHFGGETYIGYKDGTVDYRDALGRTSKAYELVAKPLPSSEPTGGDPCPCGSGVSFDACCRSLPPWERPPWNAMSLRERNLGFIRAVVGILGMDTGKDWDDVRRDLSDEQVIRIHNVVRTLWPEDTDIASLLPRPNSRTVRAVYMGPSDPRTVASSVISLMPLFDQVLVLDPFLNPIYMRPEFSPIESPTQHKQQLLKNVLFLLMLEPLIREGKLILFPDPGNMSFEFQDSMRRMAEERTADWRPSDKDMDAFKWLGRDDFQRTLACFPDHVLRQLARDANPDADEGDLGLFVTGMRVRQQEDHLSLMQILPAGESGAQSLVLRCVNLELALFVAQLTGAVIVTDVKPLWDHLHRHTRAKGSAVVTDHGTKVDQLTFRTNVHPVDALFVSDTSEAASVRKALLEIQAGSLQRVAPDHLQDLIAVFRQRLGRIPALTDDQAQSPNAIDDIAFQLSIPERGFESATVQRLIVSFGRDGAPVSAGVALFRASAPSAEEDADELEQKVTQEQTDHDGDIK